MGIDCSGVHQIIHIDPPSDLESYIQETGRVGRDGMQSVALLCKTNKEKHLDDNMIKYQSNETVCRRDLLFGLFDNYVRKYSGDLCMCCDICAKDCKCGQCKENLVKFKMYNE